MNAKQQAVFEAHKTRISRQMDEGFETLLTNQLIEMRAKGVGKSTRRAFEHAAIVHHYETVSKVMSWLELEVRRNAEGIEECDLRIRTDALDELKDLMS